MQIFTGTSGFSYPEWCGHFYPEALPGAQMLRYYATRLATVEINNTFYRMPNRDTVAAWRDEVPDSFCFAIKASRRISHQKKLVDVSEDVAHLFGVVDVLGAKLGPVLFQTPPFLKKDLAVLRDFLACLPQGRMAALEFRHPSWFSDDVYSTLSESNVALVAGDLEEEEKSPPLVATANFGYLRLRRMDYDPKGIADWGTRIAAQRWQSAYAYLKHEVLGPLFAEALRATLDGREQADLSAIRAALAAPKPKSTRGAPKSKKGEPKSAKPAAPASSKKGAEPASQAPSSRSSKPAAARASKAPASAGSKASGAPSSKAPSKSKKS
ncbi:MAG TPA: DUF72 domain-containing protein [Polyangiaceae bacterium]|nr:DUF72 domain-containing protein [Polyangiaceae bacterium]